MKLYKVLLDDVEVSDTLLAWREADQLAFELEVQGFELVKIIEVEA